MANVIFNHFDCQRCSRISSYANACRHCADAPLPDPWVVVGTTTIDGTPAQVNALFGVDAVGKTTSLGPTLVGGRMLKPTGWHLNRNLSGEALVFCDIVRRQSEIDAEKLERDCAIFDGLMRVHMANYPCPECGPHGNAGEVLLASTWVRCTLCAGGRSGDAFGVVEDEPDEGPTRDVIADTYHSLQAAEREVVDAVPSRDRANIAEETQTALSSSSIAEGANGEVAKAGVRAFLKALGQPLVDVSKFINPTAGRSVDWSQSGIFGDVMVIKRGTKS